MNTPILESEGTKCAKAELLKAAQAFEDQLALKQAAALLGRMGGLANKGKSCPQRAQSSEHCRKAVNVRWAKYRENQAAKRR